MEFAKVFAKVFSNFKIVFDYLHSHDRDLYNIRVHSKLNLSKVSLFLQVIISEYQKSINILLVFNKNFFMHSLPFDSSLKLWMIFMTHFQSLSYVTFCFIKLYDDIVNDCGKSARLLRLCVKIFLEGTSKRKRDAKNVSLCQWAQQVYKQHDRTAFPLV